MLNRLMLFAVLCFLPGMAIAEPYIVQWQQVEPAGETVMQTCDTDAVSCAVDIPFTVSGRTAPVTARLHQTEGGQFHASFDAGGVGLRNDKGQDQFLIPPAAISTPYYRASPATLTLRLPSAAAEQSGERTGGLQDLGIHNPYTPYLGRVEILVTMSVAATAPDAALPPL